MNDIFICKTRPKTDAGNDYGSFNINRSDITINRHTGIKSIGVPLYLTFKLYQITPVGCAPLDRVIVDIWHCDAQGEYSAAPNDFLRGYQITDEHGTASFKTIYPGRSQLRTAHIHFKLYARADYIYTSQIFFNDYLTDIIHTHEPYWRDNVDDLSNNEDSIYQAVGNELLIKLKGCDDGYKGIFNLALELP